MRLGSTYGPSPHTFYADPTYCPQAPKISTLVSIRPAFPAPQIPNQPGPTNSPTPRARPWHAQANPPRPADGPLKCASDQPLKFPAPTRGAWASGYGIASRCVGVSVGADVDKGSLNLHVMVRPEGRTDSSPEGGLCIGAACPLTLLFTTATSDV